MSANDYLNSKEIELFPVRQETVYSSVPTRRQQQLQHKRQIEQRRKVVKQQPKKKRPQTNTNAILQQRKRHNQRTRQQLGSMSKTGTALHSGAKKIADSVKLLSVLTLTAIGLLTGLNKYLNSIGVGSVGDIFSDLDGSGRSSGKLSAKGRDFLVKEEGLRTDAYKDSKGIWTIGVGHTGKVNGQPIGPGMKITREQALDLFDKDVAKFEAYVNKVVKVPVSQNMFDAMVSYSFNVGSLGPKFLQKLNSKDYKGAMAELTTINPELQARRQREQALFGTDITADNKLAVKEINPEVASVQKVKTTDAGVVNRYSNGSKVGNYTMANPADVRKYIDLSERAEAYLRDVGGSGLVTSGAEGSHGVGVVSHGSGNKVDIAASSNTDEAWATTAIPFIRNENTAYINFEDFTEERYQRIKKIILQKDPNLAYRFSMASSYSFGPKKAFIFCWRNPKHKTPALHLDIGILPNSYTKDKSNVNQGNQNKPKEIPKDTKQDKQPDKKQPTQNDNNKNVNVDVKNGNNNKNKGVNLSQPKMKQGKNNKKS